MAFCSKCGAQVTDGTSFCAKCGAPVAAGASSSGAVVPAAAAPTTEGLAENVASLLCYSLGWVTGIIFFLIDKRPTVRFHAAQSIVVFGGLGILYFILGRIFYGGFLFGGVGFFSLASMLFGLLELAGFVLWILLMVKAYQGERFEVPVAAGIAKSFASK